MRQGDEKTADQRTEDSNTHTRSLSTAHRAQVDEDGPYLCVCGVCVGRDACVREPLLWMWAPARAHAPSALLSPRARHDKHAVVHQNASAGHVSGAGMAGRVCAAHTTQRDTMPFPPPPARTTLTAAPTTQVGMVAGMGEVAPLGRQPRSGDGCGGTRGGEKGLPAVKRASERDIVSLFLTQHSLYFLSPPAWAAAHLPLSRPCGRWERVLNQRLRPPTPQWPPPPPPARPRPPSWPSLRRARWASWRAPACSVRRSEAAALRPGRGCG